METILEDESSGSEENEEIEEEDNTRCGEDEIKAKHERRRSISTHSTPKDGVSPTSTVGMRFDNWDRQVRTDDREMLDAHDPDDGSMTWTALNSEFQISHLSRFLQKWNNTQLKGYEYRYALHGLTRPDDGDSTSEDLENTKAAQLVVREAYNVAEIAQEILIVQSYGRFCFEFFKFERTNEYLVVLNVYTGFRAHLRILKFEAPLQTFECICTELPRLQPTFGHCLFQIKLFGVRVETLAWDVLCVQIISKPMYLLEEKIE